MMSPVSFKPVTLPRPAVSQLRQNSAHQPVQTASPAPVRFGFEPISIPTMLLIGIGIVAFAAIVDSTDKSRQKPNTPPEEKKQPTQKP